MTDPDSQQLALESGGDDFLAKHIARAALLLRVRSLLRLGQARAEEQRQRSRRARDQAVARTTARRQAELIEFLLHDLSLPASRVRTSAGRLSRSLARTPAEERLVGELEQAADELDRMTANLLDASRSASGRLPVDLATIDVPALLQ
jgi:K+-sensing histidine kinase KdpD